ncbi:progestin and adipoQ receptor family member 3-like [Liolophura sinensis]|uniref:progestin and adipoQ receptor family member 3-like n=1 Tax=Liolophura sinensis TaxID=3198878 RepID=UPI0031582517
MMGRPGGLETLKSRCNSSRSLSHSGSYHILDIEIDRGFEPCDSGMCHTVQGDIPLYKYSEVPHFLQGNPYVVHGYRVLLPFNLCVKSLFIWSNETLNIWSHLAGLFIFIYLLLYDNIIVIPANNGSLADHVIITLGIFCFQFCMACSAGFHIFCCHSERASQRWLAVDLTGISMGIIGCYLPAVHYAFYCLSIWRDLYLIIIFVLTGATLFIQLNPNFLKPSWARHRLLIYVGLVAYGVVPTIHWFVENGGWESRVVQLFVPKVIVVYLLGMLAFFFYISKFPERLFPGMFDYVGSSHQLWHVVILVTFLWWHQAGNEILLFRTSHECEA